jgi:hypothetical protein
MTRTEWYEAGLGDTHVYLLCPPNEGTRIKLTADKHYVGADSASWFMNKQSGRHGRTDGQGCQAPRRSVDPGAGNAWTKIRDAAPLAVEARSAASPEQPELLKGTTSR